jgi:threonyl-tRNA synthetase
MPEKFDLEYTGEDNQRHRPVMLHRVVLGSLERFIGILIEHFSGNMPPWLAPVQVVLLPISDKYIDYAMALYGRLKNDGYRVEIDSRIESLNKKIRNAEMQKIPYMIIIGEKEAAAGTVTIRKKSGEELKNIDMESFTEILQSAVKNKKLKP